MAGGGHRPTLKQKNKSHNHGKHRSKRDLKREAQGKVNVKSLAQKKKLKEALRLEALNKRLNDRQQGLDERRGIVSKPPRLMVIVSLERNVNPSALLKLLEESDLSAVSNVSEQKITHVSAGKLKSRMCFLVPEYGDLQSVMDASRVADVVLFLLSSQNGMDKFGDHCLSCVIGQGIASHMFVCQGLSDLNKKKSSDSRKMMEKQIDTRFPGEKVKSVDDWQDAQTLWRQVTNISLKEVHYRDSRPYLLAEKFEFHPSEQSEVEDGDQTPGLGCGTLKVSGYLKGQSLNVNQLIHIPGWGDFQMTQIDSTDDPYPLIIKGNKDRRGSKGKQADMEIEDMKPSTFCIAKATKPDSLQSEVIPDEMDQEQTWPTEDELEAAKDRIKTLKGTSDYQSSWIQNLENAESDSEDDDDEDMSDIADQNAEAMTEGDMEENKEDGFDGMTETEADDDANYDEQIDLDEEKRMYEKMKEEKLHVQFPDEIDTPVDIPARTRFARYRGMDSFRTSEWDPNDSLPYDYARIYRVNKHHYKRLKKISIKRTEEEDDDDDNLEAQVGEFITVHIKDVPKSIMDVQMSNSVITIFGLFSNEQKMTLISTLIMRMKTFNSPVKTKESLIFQIGFRRFSANPMFSEHSFQNNKFKMERFLPSSGFIVASMYAPIMFAPAPVLVFRENVMGKNDLVAKGSLLPLDTNRIVIKRAVLSGAPFKINKRSVVIRYMFFNREDIEFYKPVEVRTKYGKRGHIKQPLGTHGHMKCSFNGQFRSEDTVLMNLYKRVFPKWSYNPVVSLLPPVIEDKEEKDEDLGEMVDDDNDEKGDAYKLFD